jgi:hypothetical protein
MGGERVLWSAGRARIFGIEVHAGPWESVGADLYMCAGPWEGCALLPGRAAPSYLGGLRPLRWGVLGLGRRAGRRREGPGVSGCAE